MKDPRIRPATLSDAPALGIVGPSSFAECYGSYWRDPVLYVDFLGKYSQESFAKLLATGNLVWAAELEGRIVGFATVIKDSCEPFDNQPFGAELRHLYVMKPCRGAGIGSKLFGAVSDVLTDGEIDYLWLKVMEFADWARASYEAWGFDPIGRQPLAMSGLKVDGTMILMKKNIRHR